MLSSHIVATPNILFLGAGASKPYGKMLMGEFAFKHSERKAPRAGASWR